MEYSRFKLKLNHGIELFNLKIKSNEDYTSKSFVTLLMSPSTMKSELLKLSKKLEEDNEKFDVENFKYSNRRLFWNLVWFLELNDMDNSIRNKTNINKSIKNRDDFKIDSINSNKNKKYKSEIDINKKDSQNNFK